MTKDDFAKYLRKLRKLNKDIPLAIFMDQLSVHKCREIKALYRDLDIEQIFNVGYCPDFNPIETVFSKVKDVHNRNRLNYLVNKTPYSADKIIRDAFRSINKEHCVNCVNRSLKIL